MENQKHIMAYYPLFEHMKNEHGLTLLESELQEIIRLSDIVKKKYNEASDGKPDSNTHGGLGLHGVSNNEAIMKKKHQKKLIQSIIESDEKDDIYSEVSVCYHTRYEEDRKGFKHCNDCGYTWK